MSKFTEVFTQLESPYRCVIKSIGEPMQGKYGEVYPVVLIHDSHDVDGLVSAKSFEMSFMKNGSRILDVGMLIDVTLHASKKAGANNYLSFRAPSSSEVARAKVDPVAAATAKQTALKAEPVSNSYDLLKDLLCALLASGMDPEKAKQLAIELQNWVIVQL